MSRCSNQHNSDPAVYPHFEIYPRVQTVQPQAKVKSGGGGQESKSHIRSGLKKVLKSKPWGFGWPFSRLVSPLTTTSSSASTSTSPPAPESVIAYPVIRICELPAALEAVSDLLTNYGGRRPRGLSVLRLVPRRRTVHPCSTFRARLATKVFGRLQEVGGNEARLPGGEDM